MFIVVLDTLLKYTWLEQRAKKFKTSKATPKYPVKYLKLTKKFQKLFGHQSPNYFLTEIPHRIH